MGGLLIRLISIALLCLGANAAHAQDAISVRSGVHPDYSRLVFDWPAPPSYTVSQQGNTLVVSFEKPAQANIAGVNARELTTISDVKIASTAGENLKISLTIPQGARFRHFSAGDRIVLDVYNTPDSKKMSAERTPPAASAPAPTSAPAAKPAEEKPPEQKAAAAPPAPETPAPAATPAETAPAVQAPAVEQTQIEAPTKEAHVITLTSTKSIGLAVFQRGDTLWIVADDPDMPVPPQISGPQRDSFPPLQRIDVTGGAAYHMTLPPGLHAYGEGGGLLWRIVLSPLEKPVKAAVPERRFADGGNSLRGGTLVWPLGGVRRIMDFYDPQIGDRLKVVTVGEALQTSGPAKNFVELRTMPSVIGMALAPRTDDLSVQSAGEGVVVSRPQGLAISHARDVKPVEIREQVKPIYEQKEETPDEKKESMTRIFHFDRWEMGGLPALDENQGVLMAGIGAKEDDGKIEDLMTLAKLTLANDRGYEALGYLKVAGDALPDIMENPEYKALRGAAEALSGKYDEAIQDLSDASLADYAELGYWKAYTLAGLEDWQQADQLMPADMDVLLTYPAQLREPIALSLAEIALRAGKIDVAEGLLGMLEANLAAMPPWDNAAWHYLMGETQRQRGNKDKAKEYWKPLIDGKDDLYRAKAGLSLTRLELENNDITPAQAVDRLEGLRYLWRGDELETLINYRLGQVYIDNGDYLKGLSVMRNAVSFAPESKMAQEVAAAMTKTFRDLFMTEALSKVPPLDAVSIYDEFKELTPAGEEGDKFVETLAERLVDVDLLGRAATLLNHQITHRLSGAEKARVAVRLAAVRLLDSKPEGALRALSVAEAAMKEPPAAGQTAPEANPGREREIKLLRARALSKLKKPEEAKAILATMENDPIVSRLRADVAWTAGDWEAAAESFQDLILAENISGQRPLTPYQTDLILNRAIALNLGNNRVALANMRERFDDAMKQTPKAQLFDVVTRPRQLGLMGSRENVTSLMSEVDMFKDFLESYRKIDSGEKTN